MGPLSGIRAVEFAAIGPVPFCGLMLADHGADVIRVDRTRPAGAGLPAALLELATRGRRSIAIDLKQRAGSELALALIDTADVVLEGHRPGVMERLGLGPEACLARNERLVYGRMTGFGQNGPYAQMAGHDINYIGLVGALDAIGDRDRPTPPLNLVGDYGGGAMYLAFGVLAAIAERQHSGRGQVVDAAMVDGAASLMAPFYDLWQSGLWDGGRRANLLDGGAPFYDTYPCRDGKFVAVGPIEPQFFAEFVRVLQLPEDLTRSQLDVARWPELRAMIAEKFAERTRDEWTETFTDSDACVTPVLHMREAVHHPANTDRGVFATMADDVRPAPAPRFSRSVSVAATYSPQRGEHTDEVLRELGHHPTEIAALREAGAVA